MQWPSFVVPTLHTTLFLSYKLSFSLINSSFNTPILGESNGKSVIDRNPTRKRLILVYVITTEFERVIVTDIQTHFENKVVSPHSAVVIRFFHSAAKRLRRFSLSANWHLPAQLWLRCIPLRDCVIIYDRSSADRLRTWFSEAANPQ